MDLNRLYSDHQILLMAVDRAPSAGSRRVHSVAASQLAGCIGRKQRALGATAASAWETLAAPAEALLAWARGQGQGQPEQPLVFTASVLGTL